MYRYIILKIIFNIIYIHMYILKSLILFFIKYQSINKKYYLVKYDNIDYCDNLNYANELNNKSKNEKEKYILTNINSRNYGNDNRNKTDDNNITVYNIKLNYYKKNLLDSLENKNISINNKLVLIEYYNNIFNEKYTNNISAGGLFNDWK
jgi:hypothetical protein